MQSLSPTVEQYFSSGRRKIIDVKTERPFILIFTFDNNEKRIYDLSPKMNKGVFKKIADYEKFSKVFLDEKGNPAWDIDSNIDSSVVWNNRIDLCADACYLKSTPFR